MNKLFLIAKLCSDLEWFELGTKKAVRLSLKIGQPEIEAIVLDSHKAGVVKLLYEKTDYIILSASLVRLHNKIVLLIDEFFFFPVSQRDVELLVSSKSC